MMKSVVTVTLATLLMAAASTAALAQERERGRHTGPRQSEASQDQGRRAQERGAVYGRGIPRPAPEAARRDDPPAAAAVAPAPPVVQAPRANGRETQVYGRGVPRPPEQRGDRRDDQRSAERAHDRDDRDRGDNRYRDGRNGDNRQWDRRRGDRPPTWERGRYPPTYQSQRRFRVGAYHTPYGYYSRSWGFGDVLPRGWYGDSYRIGSFWDYDLPYPPPGYEWVRVGGDALLIDAYTGRVVQVVRYLFW